MAGAHHPWAFPDVFPDWTLQKSSQTSHLTGLGWIGSSFPYLAHPIVPLNVHTFSLILNTPLKTLVADIFMTWGSSHGWYEWYEWGWIIWIQSTIRTNPLKNPHCLISWIPYVWYLNHTYKVVHNLASIGFVDVSDEKSLEVDGFTDQWSTITCLKCGSNMTCHLSISYVEVS